MFKVGRVGLFRCHSQSNAGPGTLLASKFLPVMFYIYRSPPQRKNVSLLGVKGDNSADGRRGVKELMYCRDGGIDYIRVSGSGVRTDLVSDADNCQGQQSERQQW